MGIVFPNSYDAFISYANSDNVLHDDVVGHFRSELSRKLQVELKERLRHAEGREVDFFMDRDGLPANGDLSDTLRTAISKSLFLIVFVGKWYPESKWCGRELVEFLTRFNGARSKALEHTFIIVLDKDAEKKSWGNHLDSPERPIFKRFYDQVTGRAIPVFVERDGLALLSPRFSRLLREVMETMADRVIELVDSRGAA